ncbi:unnamed protein product (macronuclear) [Paramecium tetraurelia]|uniref:GPI-GlcNAc transferase complex PIG-H component conserved domain-containing protein n=1 Tax=Paramecium tetraurelia TaxID=5888 RepID=A0DW54_PARTE|nr:uncharacterized protein GSPATT00020924001 [Paramecium tetraurelia]CAK87271.1 unnamed protein product [Paramecium tetraurelia]|eukprot:XP_001454668.1 hypothetical protein (macronuclear) [Paramecium tetraurelia strain d4-2]
MDEQRQNKIILKILVKQALIQQYLININVCCLLNDYFYTIALNGLAIIFIAFVYHIVPLKSSKIKYILEYSLLAGVQVKIQEIIGSCYFHEGFTNIFGKFIVRPIYTFSAFQDLQNLVER